MTKRKQQRRIRAMDRFHIDEFRAAKDSGYRERKAAEFSSLSKPMRSLLY